MGQITWGSFVWWQWGQTERAGADARQFGARRVLALLVYAQSNDLVVPNRVIEQLFEEIYKS